MQLLFVSIYQFFSKRKPLLWLVVLLTLGMWGFLSTRIQLKEDISSMLPDSKAIRAMNDVISHTQAGEQVIFLMSFNDSSHTEPDSLITAAADVHENLLNRFDKYIDTI